jgi:hypothetical protein
MIDILKLREKVFCFTAIKYVESQQCFIKPDSQMKKFGYYAVRSFEEYILHLKDYVKRSVIVYPRAN